MKYADKFKKKEYYTIDYQDLDDLISEVYGRPFEFVPVEEMSNDSEKKINVKKEELDKWDRKSISEFGNYSTRNILVDMCNRELIPEGSYLVSVCW